MNIKDHEQQEDMEISEKQDDTGCNIYRTLWKTYTKKEMAYTQHIWDNYVCCMFQMCTSRHRLRPRL